MPLHVYHVQTTSSIALIVIFSNHTHSLLHVVVRYKLYYSITESISLIRVKLVRVGHPARLLPQVLECALDAQVFVFYCQEKFLDHGVFMSDMVLLYILTSASG